MDFKNLSENLIIVLFSTLLGAGIGYFASTYSNKQTIQLLKPTIEEAIKKETTSIFNEYKTEIGKVKTNKGVIKIDPTATLKNEVAISKPKDTIKTTKKRKKILGIF